jgi:hypothetical protein
MHAHIHTLTHVHTHTWMCLTVSCHPLLVVGQLWSTAFHARQSTTIFCTSCLYMPWNHFPGQWNEHSGPTEWPPQSPDLTCDFFLWCWAKEVYRSKSRTLEKLEQQVQDIFCCSSWLRKVKCWVCVFQAAKVCAKCWGLCWNLTLNGSVWASK